MVSQVKVLITGGTGFLGQNIVKSLRQNKNLDIFSPSRWELDLENRLAVEKYISEIGPEMVVHAAAKVGGIGLNSRNGFNLMVTNATIDSNLLGVCFDLKVSKLVSFGSSCMYPSGSGRAMTEQEVDSGSFEPTNQGFAIAKTYLQNLIRVARDQGGFCWTQIVLSNLYGPGDNFDPNTSHLLGAVINKLECAERDLASKVSIWGSGKPRREFTFVEDVSDWLADFVTSNPEKWPVSLNVGYGKDYSVSEIYSLAAQIFEWKGEFQLDESKPDGAMDKLMDSSIARNSFNWNPQTDLETGMRQTIHWKSRRL